MKKSRGMIISGIRRRMVRIRMVIHLYRQARKVFGTHRLAVGGLKELLALRAMTHGKNYLPKIYKVGKQYISSLNVPAWPSAAFNRFFENELLKVKNPNASNGGLQSIVFSITARCSYFCEHCYEWENISSKEILSLEELQLILDKIHKNGISHVQFSGGEPLARMEDMLVLLNSSIEEAEYWILTSGYGLTAEAALQMKEGGLRGAIISLDHWDEKEHNRFRKHDEAFFWAKEAVVNCNKAGLATALSVCVTKEFVSKENLWKFAHLANEWGVGFIRILEPRAVGRFAGKEVILNSGEKQIIKDFFLDINYSHKYNHYPIVMYLGFHQKEKGCFGAGNRFMYIDSKAEVHACPFCQGSVGNALKEELPDVINALRERGCHMYRSQ